MMSDTHKAILHVLEDGQGHTTEEIAQRVSLIIGASVTVHSRIAELRNKHGYVIKSFRVGKQAAYRLTGRTEGVVRVRPISNPVSGYEFMTEANHDRNRTICKIVGKAEASDHEVLENGPAFTVEFGDGHRMTAFASELSPWYAT